MSIERPIQPAIKIPDWANFRLSNKNEISLSTVASIEDLVLACYETGANETEMAIIFKHLTILVEKRRGIIISRTPQNQNKLVPLNGLIVKNSS